MLSILELVKGAPGGAYGITTRNVLKKSGSIMRGKGLFGKIPGAKNIHKGVVTAQMQRVARGLKRPLLSEPSPRDIKLATAIEKGSSRLSSRG